MGRFCRTSFDWMTRPDWSWVPNGLTVLRFVLGVTFPWSPAEWQFSILLVAGMSDLIDGWIGRLLGATSGFGQFFDPIADKTLVLSTVATAFLAGWITWLELLGLAARDLTVLVLGGWALAQDWGNWRKLKPQISGKIATGGQLVALLALFWNRTALPELVWTAAALSVVSVIDYTYRAYRATRSPRRAMTTSSESTSGPGSRIG